MLTVLALNQTSAWPLLSRQMIACVVAAAVFLLLFAHREANAAYPLVELRLFHRGDFCAGILGVALGYALLYGTLFLSSYALLHGWHNSERITGLKLAVIPIAIGVFAPIGIALSHTWGAHRVGAAGMVLCLAALLMLVSIGLWLETESLAPGLGGMFVFGAGLGLFMAPNSNATIAAAPVQHSATAAGMVNLMSVLGSCLGVSAASSMMSWRLEQRIGHDGLDRLFQGRVLLDAIESSLAVLVAFAIAGALLSLLRPVSVERN